MEHPTEKEREEKRKTYRKRRGKPSEKEREEKPTEDEGEEKQNLLKMKERKTY